MTKITPIPTIQSELERVQLKVASDKSWMRETEDVQKELLMKEAAKERQRSVGDIKSVLMRPEGRRLIFKIIEESKSFSTSFVPGQSDVTAFNEGQRAVGMFLINLAEEAEPGICLQMAREAKSDRIASLDRSKKIMENI